MVPCLGSLVQLRCGEGGVLQTDIAVCGEHSRVPATLGFPRSRVCELSLSTLLRLLAALYGASPALRAVPVFGYSTKARTRLCLRFVPSPAGAAQAAGSLTGALSPGAVRLLPSAAQASVSTRASRVCAPCVYSWELASSRNPPGGCRPSRISGGLWLETGGPFAVW